MRALYGVERLPTMKREVQQQVQQQAQDYYAHTPRVGMRDLYDQPTSLQSGDPYLSEKEAKVKPK